MTAQYLLDSRTQRKDGTQPLKVKIYRDRSNYFLLSLKIYLLPHQWDGKSIKNHDESLFLNARLNNYRRNIAQELLNIDFADKPVPMPEVKTRMEAILTQGDCLEDKNSFFEYFQSHIDKIKKPSTKSTFELALKNIRLYVSKDPDFPGVTVRWLKGFEYFCLYEKKLSVNSTSIYLRNIRTVFNSAIDDGIASLGDYPFRRFKIKNEKTAKRSLTIEQIKQLRDYDCEPHARQYIDIFMLIFYLQGINIVDLVNLKGIENGRINYRRAKTGRLYSVRVGPEAIEIIEKYRGETHLLNILDRYNDYHNFLHRMNKNLKEIGTVEILPGRGGKKKKTGLFPDLSTYWARHSWATIAAGLDIPKETIAAALGHGGNSVTDIYIDFDQRKVDEANRKAIDAIK